MIRKLSTSICTLICLASSWLILGNYFPHQWDPLHMAAMKGNLEKVKDLVGKGADINITDDRGVSFYVLQIKGRFVQGQHLFLWLSH